MSFKLQSQIPQLTAELQRRAGQLVRGTAKDVEGRAKILAPVDTGILSKSIQTEMAGDLSAVVFVAAEYGIYQEFGTHKMSAHPFLGPAFEAAKPDFETGLKELLKI